MQLYLLHEKITCQHQRENPTSKAASLFDRLSSSVFPSFLPPLLLKFNDLRLSGLLSLQPLAAAAAAVERARGWLACGDQGCRQAKRRWRGLGRRPRSATSGSVATWEDGGRGKTLRMFKFHLKCPRWRRWVQICWSYSKLRPMQILVLGR